MNFQAVLELLKKRRLQSIVLSDIGQIIKSLIFIIKETKKPVLALISGSNRANEEKIKTMIGEKIAKAAPDFVRDITVFATEGVPPIGRKENIGLIFIDEDLLKFKEIWGAAGTPNAVFCINSKSLVEITKGKITSIN